MPMQLTVLVDNNTLIDRYLLAEPGLSFLVETDGTRVLFDVGYSDIFLRNAQKMGIDLSELDYVALSHSHEDHTWGLGPLARHYAELQWEKRPLRRPALVAHPKAFMSVSGDAFMEGGPLMSRDKLSRHFRLQLDTKPQWLTPRLVYLTGIPRGNAFEGKLGFGRKEGETAEDTVPEDAALAYRSSAGLVVIVGCSHAGVCNTIEYAKEICSESRVVDVIGGFHLQKPTREHLEGTLAYFRDHGPHVLHACHCTDLSSKIRLAAVADVQEVGVGLVLQHS